MLTAGPVHEAKFEAACTVEQDTGASRGSSGTVQTVVVGGFPTAIVTRRRLASIMVDDCMRARQAGSDWTPRLVFSSNAQGIALAGRNTVFARTMEQADIIHADGMPVVMASRFTRQPLPERICTTDFFVEAAESASVHGLRFFMLGGTEAQNQAVVDAIHRDYPQVQVAGRHHGYIERDRDEEICAIVRESRADVLWVAMGKPLQEEWSVRNRARLAGVGWIKTCGGLYSFVTGEAKRAPKWMQGLGLEWAYRGGREPLRLGVRYVMTNPYALVRLMTRTELSG